MRLRCPRLASLLLGFALAAVAAGLIGAEDLPIVDTHLHYSQNSWSEYSPEAVLAILDGAGVRRAFVSSTPDDGTVRLYEAAPDRIVPVLRPYRDAGELGSWHRDPTVVAYLETRLARARLDVDEAKLLGQRATDRIGDVHLAPLQRRDARRVAGPVYEPRDPAAVADAAVAASCG